MKAIKHKTSLLAFAVTATFGLGVVGNVNQVIAGTDTTNLNATASISTKCKLANSVPVSFGSYDPVVTNAAAVLDSTGSFDVKCTKGGTGTLKLDHGLYSANAVGTTRALKASGSATYLNYDLYSDSGHSSVWNDTTQTITYGPTSNASYTTETIYAEAPAAQINAVADSYADTVVITVAY